MEAQYSFDKVINTWRHLSGEGTEASMKSMSGDSQPYKQKEEEGDLLVPDKTKASTAINVSTTLAVTDASQDITGQDILDEKLGHVRYEMENSKEAAGDTDEKHSKSDIGNSEHDEIIKKISKTKTECENDIGDKVDSVYIRPPSLPDKTYSTASIKEEEDCGINCLYYTLQCCDCVIM